MQMMVKGGVVERLSSICRALHICYLEQIPHSMCQREVVI
jgi:hypothetical protein